MDPTPERQMAAIAAAQQALWRFEPFNPYAPLANPFDPDPPALPSPSRSPPPARRARSASLCAEVPRGPAALAVPPATHEPHGTPTPADDMACPTVAGPHAPLDLIPLPPSREPGEHGVDIDLRPAGSRWNPRRWCKLRDVPSTKDPKNVNDVSNVRSDGKHIRNGTLASPSPCPHTRPPPKRHYSLPPVSPPGPTGETLPLFPVAAPTPSREPLPLTAPTPPNPTYMPTYAPTHTPTYTPAYTPTYTPTFPRGNSPTHFAAYPARAAWESTEQRGELGEMERCAPRDKREKREARRHPLGARGPGPFDPVALQQNASSATAAPGAGAHFPPPPRHPSAMASASSHLATPPRQWRSQAAQVYTAATPASATLVSPARVSTTPASPLPGTLTLQDDLRPLYIPEALIPTFVALAEENTARGIETCGMLMGQVRTASDPRLSGTHSYIPESGGASRGKLQGEMLVVTLLAVPQQKGTSDTCTTSHEEDVVGLMVDRSLVALGWIHTHPTQTVFMSSLDLHTHAAYQGDLPEAVAIVCSPFTQTGDKVGMFRLTRQGLRYIQSCHLPGFHPHLTPQGQPVQNLYTDTFGHVVILSSHTLPLDIVDFRPRTS